MTYLIYEYSTFTNLSKLMALAEDATTVALIGSHCLAVN